MNRVTVLKATAGICEYLNENGYAGQKVLIGFDARHNSDVFAKDTAQILAGYGLTPVIFDHVVPTPVLAFAIRNLEACAGIMVTASHNPPQDNGYKVYLGDGRQIVSPADVEILNQINKIVDVRDLKYSTVFDIAPQQIEVAYLKSIEKLINTGPVSENDRKNIKVVYTAMHGVGWNTLKSAFKVCKFNEPIAVIEQRDPDPNFPTVLFPNPEEKGALDLAIAKAQTENADLLLANDPDADRLAVALPTANGDWKMLRGDQIGILLGWWVSERARLTGREISGTIASSIVSSMMLAVVAKGAGLNYEHTLTGFKWVSRVPNLIYGYEEALGYCVDPTSVGDKDGISAAAMFTELTCALKLRGQTAWQLLDELATKYGLFASDQISVRVNDITAVPEIMAQLRSNPPKKFGELIVSQVLDLSKPESNLPPTDGIIYYLTGSGHITNGRVIIRPSGTEPKIKCYLEVVSTVEDLDVASKLTQEALVAVARDAKPLLTGGN
jgi:phosphomannomutase